MIDKIKDILICLLIILTLVQVYDLWKESTFFIGIANFFDKEENSKSAYVLNPDKIMISTGDDTYIKILKDTNQDELVKAYEQKIYEEIFRKRTSFKVADVKIEDLISKKSVIFTYDMSFSNGLIQELNGSDNYRIRNLNTIYSIIVLPQETDDEKTTIYIYGLDEDKETVLAVANLDVDTLELAGLIDEINIFNDSNEYKLIWERTENHDRKFDFELAKINDESKEVNYFEMTNPFEISSETVKPEDVIEEYANNYFENPKSKWKVEKTTDLLIFGDGDTSIQISKDGYASYTNSRTISKVVSARDALETANKFINNDIYIADKVKLVSAKNNNGKYEFVYKYNAGGFDFEIPEETLAKYKLSNAVTIIVDGDEVSSIKLVVRKFTDTKPKAVDEEISKIQ